MRLMTVPGVGPIISTAMVVAIGTGDIFARGRDFGAWLGLVPCAQIPMVIRANGSTERSDRLLQDLERQARRFRPDHTAAL